MKSRFVLLKGSGFFLVFQFIYSSYATEHIVVPSIINQNSQMNAIRFSASVVNV